MTVRDTIASVFGGGDYSDLRAREAAEADLREARAHGVEVVWDDLVQRGDAMLQVSTGTLWQYAPAQFTPRFQEAGARFTIGPSGYPMWLREAQPYATLADAEAADATQRAEVERVEAERVAVLDAAPLQPVTLSDVESRRAPTLAEAAALIERERGELRVVDDRLVVFLRACDVSVYVQALLLDAARVLYLAERAVVDCLNAGAPLPDGALTPGGAPIIDPEEVPRDRRTRRPRNTAPAGALA